LKICPISVAHRFRWVFCQLDVLRRTPPAQIRSTLDDMPKTLDETYDHALLAMRQYAERLFQFLPVTLRPLRVEDPADILAVRFDSGALPKFNPDGQLGSPEEAVLSVCSNLADGTGVQLLPGLPQKVIPQKIVAQQQQELPDLSSVSLGSLGGLGGGAGSQATTAEVSPEQIEELRRLVAYNPILTGPLLEQLKEEDPDLYNYIDGDPEKLLLAFSRGDEESGPPALPLAPARPPSSTLVPAPVPQRIVAQRQQELPDLSSMSLGALGGLGGGAGSQATTAEVSPEQIEELRRLVAYNPILTGPLLEQLKEEDPVLYNYIDGDPEKLLLAFSRGDEESGPPALPPAPVRPPSSTSVPAPVPQRVLQPTIQSQTISITWEEHEQIEHIVGMGFERQVVLQAYLAGDRNAERALDYLLEGAFE